MQGRDLVGEIPAERWSADDVYDAEPGIPGKSVSRWGAFLDDPTGFDYPFFGFGEPEALAMDPQHRLLLEVSWEAAEHAGYDPQSLNGCEAGVFFGLSHQDYMQVTRDAGVLGRAYAFTGTPFSMASGRVSHAMGLKGPALSIDTACSSSLVAVHEARRSLLAGECRVALAGGVMMMFSPPTFAAASGLGMLSPTGRCHAFDARADGFVRAEGCGVVMLKRLEDAQADNDRVLAVIRGSAVNQNGRNQNILAPSRAAQSAVIERALAEAGVDPTSVGMVEAHGTGTVLGDTEEFHSLSAHYGRGGRCALGSLKSNLGHAESAAGVLGLIKAILSVGQGVVPRSLHHERLPSHLQGIETGLFVPTATSDWPQVAGGEPRRAAVSSYGMSGTNAHLVLEQAPVACHGADADADADAGTGTSTGTGRAAAPGMARLFPVSASSPQALCATAARLADWIEARGAQVSAADVGRTLACGRGQRQVRRGLVAGTLAGLTAQLRGLAAEVPEEGESAEGDGRGPVFVFSGHGSQWETMGVALLQSDAVFAETVAAIEPLVLAEAGFSVTQALCEAGYLDGIERVQPAIFAVQVGLAASLKASGVVPAAVIGHSMGEVAAAVVAGGLSLEDGVRVICHRALLCARLAGRGAMAVVEMAPAALRDDLARRGAEAVEIAVMAAPNSTVVGGPAQAVRDLVAAWQAEGVFAREVSVDVASHTSQVEPVLDELSACLAGVAGRGPHTTVYSTAMIDPRGAAVFDASYWVDNLRHTVRFRPAVQAALEDGHRVFVELSPHPIVTRAVVQNAAALDLPVRALPSMTRGEAMPQGVLDVVAAIFAAGAAVEFGALHPDGRLIDLPLPVWTHHRLFLKPEALATGAHHIMAEHPLLNVHRALQEEPERHFWASELGLAAHPWLVDHKVSGVALFPGAGYCEMALAAARMALGTARVEVRDMRFEQALALEAATPVVGTAVLEPAGELLFRIESRTGGAARVHASAVLAAAQAGAPPAAHDPDRLRSATGTGVPAADLWQWFEARGIGFGPSFRALARGVTVSADGASLVAELGLPSALRQGARGYGVHPVLLDACFQSVGAFAQVRSETEGRMLLPLSVRRLQMHDGDARPAFCVTRLVSVDAVQVEADIDLIDATGRVILTAQGLIMGSGGTGQTAAAVACNDRLLDVMWEPWEIPPAPLRAQGGSWLLIGAEDGRDLMGRIDAGLRMQGVGVGRIVAGGENGSENGGGGTWQVALADRLERDRPEAVVVVLPVGQEPETPDAARAHVGFLMHVARLLTDAARRPRLYVISCMALRVVPGEAVGLGHGGVRGWLRALGAEVPALHPTLVDTDPGVDARALNRLLLCASDEDELALRGGAAHVARLVRAPLGPEDRRRVECDVARDGLRLEIRSPGDLGTLELTAVERREPAAGEVEVAVHATSVNFADVLVAMGRYPSFEGRAQGLGLDFAGVVVAVGAGVSGLRAGDRVAGLCAGGAWGTRVICDARLVVAIPAGLSDVEAAAVLTTTATAWHGLAELARIGHGDRVLIHSATGGVGQAAVAIARRAGAEIFATAGSEARRGALRARGIAHVYDSRSAGFAELIRQDTAGRGVDIVLNSLTGAAQRAGIDLLEPGGRFVEIGKKDIYGGSWLGLAPFKRNLAFFSVDLALMCSTAPHRIQALLARVMELVAGGEIVLPDITTRPLAEAAEAIRVLGNAGHSGKIVLTVGREGHCRVPVAPWRVRPFRSDGAYIITGGLGGLGLYLAETMSAAGCGRLVLNSRSAAGMVAGSAAEQALAAMRARGTEVEVIGGSIADAATARRLVEAAKATGLPLRGVLHGAAVVEDGTLASVTEAVLARNWAPKVEGAWHLHVATGEERLDWFCLFSSVAALFGSPGQTAYAAANSWLDSFAAWRRAQGLPASSVAWAAWAEIGAGAHLAARGDARMIEPQDGAYAFEALLRHDRVYAAYAHADGAPWLVSLAGRSPFAAGLSQARVARGDPAQRLRAELQATPQEEWPAILRRLVTDHLTVILRRTVGLDRPFFDCGLDSLGTLQLLLGLEADTGVRLGAMDVTTVRGLADRLGDALRGAVPAEACHG